MIGLLLPGERLAEEFEITSRISTSLKNAMLEGKEHVR